MNGTLELMLWSDIKTKSRIRWNQIIITVIKTNWKLFFKKNANRSCHGYNNDVTLEKCERNPLMGVSLRKSKSGLLNRIELNRKELNAMLTVRYRILQWSRTNRNAKWITVLYNWIANIGIQPQITNSTQLTQSRLTFQESERKIKIQKLRVIMALMRINKSWNFDEICNKKRWLVIFNKHFIANIEITTRYLASN